MVSCLAIAVAVNYMYVFLCGCSKTGECGHREVCSLSAMIERSFLVEGVLAGAALLDFGWPCEL